MMKPRITHDFYYWTALFLVFGILSILSEDELVSLALKYISFAGTGLLIFLLLTGNFFTDSDSDSDKD